MNQNVKDAIDGKWIQVSRKYRRFVRPAPGKTGLEMLREVAPDIAERMLERLNHEAAVIYAHFHAKPEDTLVLSVEDFDEYLVATGRSPYRPKHEWESRELPQDGGGSRGP